MLDIMAELWFGVILGFAGLITTLIWRFNIQNIIANGIMVIIIIAFVLSSQKYVLNPSIENLATYLEKGINFLVLATFLLVGDAIGAAISNLANRSSNQ
jgi:hypothetical protein